MQDKQAYLDAIQLVLDEAKAQGASACECAMGVEAGLSASVRLGEVETLEYHQDKGLGITVYLGQSKGSASTSDLSADSIKQTVSAACGIAKYTAADECAGLPEKDRLAWDYPDLDLYHAWDVQAEQALELAKECEDHARAFDKRISNSEGATTSSHRGNHFYANSHGFIGHYPSSRHSVVCSVIAQDEQGMQRDYWYTASRNPKELESMRQIGETAAKRAVARLNARQLPTGQWPVLFTPDTAIGLVGHFIRGIRGGSLYRKTSFLLDSMGEQIFPDWIHMDEQPHIKAALGSAPFDSEGVATQSRDLVKAGVVQAYVLDTYSARRLNMETTGNAGGVHNLTLESSGHSYEDLLSQMGTGLIVTDLMGQGVNNVTGTYSRGAAGFWLENGEIQFPVHEITIASNLKEMFKGIIAVGNDMDHRRNIRTGSILVDKMTIAGE